VRILELIDTVPIWALTLSLLVARVASASPSEGTVSQHPHVDYQAPAMCPGEPAFEAELARHLGADVFARFGESSRTLAVSVETASGGFRAVVALIDDRGARVERGISALTCEQAVRAIALIAALAVRSQLEQASLEKDEAVPKSGVRSVQPASPRPRVQNEDPPLGSAPSVERAPRVTVVRSVVFGLSGGVGAAAGVGPHVAPGLLVRFRAAFGHDSEHSIALVAMGYDTFRSSLEVADVRFRVLKARLELCPVEPRLSRRWLSSACAGFELGSQAARSYADGVRVQTPRTSSQRWMAATLAGRLGLSVEPLVFSLGPELGVPIRRNAFALTRPERLVYRVPSAFLGFSVAIGVTWR
jgi:hypothetical protein